MVKATIEIGLVDNVTKGVNEINKAVKTIKSTTNFLGAEKALSMLTRAIRLAITALTDYAIAGTQVTKATENIGTGLKELAGRFTQNNQFIKYTIYWWENYIKSLNDSMKAGGKLLESETKAGKERIEIYKSEKKEKKIVDDTAKKEKEAEEKRQRDEFERIQEEGREADRQAEADNQEKIFNDAVEMAQAKKEQIKTSTDEVAGFFQAMATSSLDAWSGGLDKMGEQLGNFLIGSIKAWVATEIGKALASAFFTAGASLGVMPAAAAAGVAAEAAISSALPFQEGGIVPGNSYSGDRVPARMNSGEMVLTREDQASLLNMIRGGGGAGRAVDVTLNIDGAKLARILAKTDAKIARGMA